MGEKISCNYDVAMDIKLPDLKLNSSKNSF